MKQFNKSTQRTSIVNRGSHKGRWNVRAFGLYKYSSDRMFSDKFCEKG